MIAGLEEISDGTISIDSRVVNHFAPEDRNVAMAFRNSALYPLTTVEQNMDGRGCQAATIPCAECQRCCENHAG